MARPWYHTAWPLVIALGVVAYASRAKAGPRLVGVKQAGPAKYDPTAGVWDLPIVEQYDDGSSDLAHEWVKQAAQPTPQDWATWLGQDYQLAPSAIAVNP